MCQQVRVFAGVCPMMAAVNWAEEPAALLGMDLLQGERGLVLDFEKGTLRLF